MAKHQCFSQSPAAIIASPWTPEEDQNLLNVISLSILCATLTAPVVLPLLLKVIFKGHSSEIKDAFTLSIMIAFSGSFSALFLRTKPKVGRFFQYCSVLAMTAAMFLLMFTCASSILSSCYRRGQISSL